MFSSMLSLLGSLRRGNFVQNSLRFRSSASANLSRTTSGTGSNTTATVSFWVKRGSIGSTQALFGSTQSPGSDGFNIWFDSSDRLNFQINASGGSTNGSLVTSQVFRDPSSWYHIVCAVDTTNATASNRMLIYVNGVQITLFSTNITPTQNSTIWLGTSGLTNFIARVASSAMWFLDGYLAEYNVINGQALTPSSFGQIESTTGVWSPKPYVGSYGTNGFYLKFGNTSSVAALGTDSSGNNNTWTVNNVSLTAGVTYDSMLDVPVNYSDGGNGRGNYCTLNPLDKNSAVSLNSGNLTSSLNSSQGSRSTFAVSSGKWYFETVCTSAILNDVGIGICRASDPSVFSTSSTGYAYYSSGVKANNNTATAYGSSWTLNDVIGVAVDLDAGQITFYKNNVTQGVAFTGISGEYFFAVQTNGSGSSNANFNFGQRPFQNTTAWATLQAAGFRALNTNNLPTPSIVNGANFMAATTYTGNGAARSLSNAVNNVSFQPDLVWIKSRTPGATSHALFDSVRGAQKYLSSDTTAAETTNANTLTAFGADGFSLGTDTTLVNASANLYVAWQWRESVTAGLDVVTYAGTGVNRTVAHNLGVAPAMVIVKRSQTGATSNWQVRHTSIAAANSIQLNLTNQAAAAATVWNSTAPTSSVFSLGTSTDVNASGISYVAYCFAEIAGFSKFGSYAGNNSTDGPFVFCGFRPRFVLMKNSTNGVVPWLMYDSSRDVSNVEAAQLLSNSANTETSVAFCDFTANGFKIRQTGTSYNETGQTYIFAAFAEVPSKYALAR